MLYKITPWGIEGIASNRKNPAEYPQMIYRGSLEDAIRFFQFTEKEKFALHMFGACNRK